VFAFYAAYFGFLMFDLRRADHLGSLGVGALARARRHHRGDRQLRLHHRALPPGDRELVMRNLTQVEGMSLDVLRAGIRWDFETCRSTSTCSSAAARRSTSPLRRPLVDAHLRDGRRRDRTRAATG
jgi:hypothetical protein